MSTGYWALMHLVLPEDLTSHYFSLSSGLTMQLPHGSREGSQVVNVHLMSRNFYSMLNSVGGEWSNKG